MAKARLKFNDKEIEIGEEVISFGRGAENTVAFENDPNISRNHAEIEYRDKQYWLVDLDSSNGTTINGQKVSEEIPLNDGDFITLGNSVIVEFVIEEIDDEDEEEETAEDEQEAEAVTPEAKKSSKLLIAAGAICGLAVVFIVAAGIVAFTRNTECQAIAVITKPESGDTLKEPTEIEVQIQNADCVKQAIFLINGREFARTEDQPFSATIDPKQFPELADGGIYSLQVVLEDAEGNKIPQPRDVALAFETIQVETPTPTPETGVTPDGGPTPKPTKNKTISVIEVNEMSKRILKQFSGNTSYKLDNQFLQEVQKKTAEYTSEGYFERAAQYRDVINVAFVQEQNLDAPLGYVLAMSRSQFKPENQGADEGLWRMTNDFVVLNAYNGLCGMETLSDKSQNCAAKAASLYLKALVLNVFDGDLVYGVAAFGMTPGDASVWKAGLPADRTDFWKVLATAPKEREEVVKFFAAALVAENPQKFGLKKEKPISELYRNIIGN